MAFIDQFPATKRVNLQSGSHDCCDAHGAVLIDLAVKLGQVFTTSMLRERAECDACRNDHNKGQQWKSQQELKLEAK